MIKKKEHMKYKETKRVGMAYFHTSTKRRIERERIEYERDNKIKRCTESFCIFGQLKAAIVKS